MAIPAAAVREIDHQMPSTPTAGRPPGKGMRSAVSAVEVSRRHRNSAPPSALEDDLAQTVVGQRADAQVMGGDIDHRGLVVKRPRAGRDDQCRSRGDERGAVA